MENTQSRSKIFFFFGLLIHNEKLFPCIYPRAFNISILIANLFYEKIKLRYLIMHLKIISKF